MTERDIGISINPETNGYADLGEAFIQYYVPIYRYVYKRVSDSELAEDITMDVFQKALESIDSYQQMGYSISSWLYKIAYHLIITHYRRNEKRREIYLDDIQEEILPESNKLLIDEEAIQDLEKIDPYIEGDLQHAISTLTDLRRSVIVMRFLHEFGISEVAIYLGRTEQSIKNSQHFGRANLQKLMAHHNDDFSK